MVGDFLLESRCRHGHASSATFRGYAREQVEHVVRELSDECYVSIDDETLCSQRVAHVVTDLGDHSEATTARKERRAADTKPGMPAVRPPMSELPGPRDSLAPLAYDPPSDLGPIIAGD